MSGKAKFTPGPWIFGERSTATRAIAVGNTGKNYGVWPDTTGREEMFDEGDPSDDPEIARANGRLIAAAPDLYEALRALMEDEPDCLPAETPRTIAAEAALKKARGEP